jgi:hypothetical protein
MLQLAANKYKIDFIIFLCNDTSKGEYEQHSVIKSNEHSQNVANLLLVYGKDIDGIKGQHVMYIKDVDALTKVHMCPKCYWIPSASDNGCYNKDRFKQHVDHCDGKRFSEVKLNEIAEPHAKYLMSNPLYAYLFAHGRINEYHFLSDYITFDFETMTKTTNNHYGSRSVCEGYFYHITAAWCVKCDEEIYHHAIHRNADSNEEFINKFIEALFKEGIGIFGRQTDYYKSLNLPEYIINKISQNENNPYGIVVKVLGFNSRKFDINIFINYISESKLLLALDLPLNSNP